MLTPPTSLSTSGYYSDDATSFLTTRDPRGYKRKRAEDSFDSLISLFDDALNGSITVINQNTWKRHFSGVDFEQALEIPRFLFDNPTVISHMEIGKAKRLSIKPWGEAKHTFAEFPSILMKIIGSAEDQISLFQDELSLKIAKLFKKTVFKTTALDALLALNIEQSKLLGRTITIPDPENPGFLLAHKFKRVDEKLDDFCREAAITELYK